MYDRRDLTPFEGIPGTRFKIRDVTSDHKYLHKWSLQAEEAAKKLVVCYVLLSAVITQRHLIAQGKGKDDEAEKVLRDARVVIGDDKVDAILMLSQLRQLRKHVQRRLASARAHYGRFDSATLLSKTDRSAQGFRTKRRWNGSMFNNNNGNKLNQ